MRRRSAAALIVTLVVVGVCCSDSGHRMTRPISNARRPVPTTQQKTAPCTADPGLAAPNAPVPPDVVFAVQRFANDPGLTGDRVGLSIWIDGLGEVGALAPDVPLLPASNQKLLTAMGVLSVLNPGARLTTVVQTTPDRGLAIVGGGDPSLTARGPNSLDALAAQVRAAGVTSVSGPLVVDESRYDGIRRAGQWQDSEVPAYAGPLSALMVDDNRYRRDAGFLADPALANGEAFRFALAAHGVAVSGPTVHGVAAPKGPVIASLTSAPVSALLTDTLLRSDNMAAEELLKEVGHSNGAPGSTARGLALTRAALAPLCVPLAGTDDDGSGLSPADNRSPREWRELLQAARAQPWFPLLRGALPLAGRSGTLSTRFRRTAAEGNVRAKTGTIPGGIALSGYGTTAGGRGFVFSVLVNGARAPAAERPLDALITAIAAHPG